MTTKEWLNRGRRLKQRLSFLEKERDRALENAERVTAAPVADKVQTSPENSSEKAMAAYADYAAQVQALFHQVSLFRIELMAALAKVRNDRLRLLLFLRYLDGETWETIAEELEVSVYWARSRLHDRAVRAVEKIREK